MAQWIQVSRPERAEDHPPVASPYVHAQNIASAIWTIDHGLGRKPSVSFTDSGGNEVEGDVEHPSVNQTIGSFSSPFSGEAYLI